MKLTKQEKSWILYDWANSVYAVIMMSAVVPIYFSTVAASAGQSGDFWWGMVTSVSMIMIALSAPFIGAFADYHGYKKRLFVLFLVIGLCFTALVAFTDNWALILIGYGVSHVGFNGTILLNDAFLPDITTHQRMDKISAYGFAFGYIGGSTIPFLISIGLIQFGEVLGLTGTVPVKLSIVITVVWWLLFSIPFLKNVGQTHGIDKPKSHILRDTIRNTISTGKKIIGNKGILYFILAYFCYIDGVGTVIAMSTAYGATLGLDTTGMILALLVTQIVAFPCSILFSMLSKRFGSLRMLLGAIIIYFFICIVGFVMGFGLEEKWFGVSQALVLFWILAVMVGTVQGGIQALSRSYYGKLIPPENAGEFFGFFDIFGKFAAVVGPALYGFVKLATGRSSFSILSLVLLFGIAFVILARGRKYLN